MFNLVVLSYLLMSFSNMAVAIEPRAAMPRIPVRPAAPQGNSSTVNSFKSYRDWKAEQVAYWQSRGQGDMAKELTVADYFAGYLTKQKDRTQAIKEVSARLSADEVAELMTIYANSVFGSHSPQVPLQAELPVRENSK